MKQIFYLIFFLFALLESMDSIIQLDEKTKQEARAKYREMVQQKTLNLVTLSDKLPTHSEHTTSYTALKEFKRRFPLHSNIKTLDKSNISTRSQDWEHWLTTTAPNLPDSKEDLLALYAKEHSWQCSLNVVTAYLCKQNPYSARQRPISITDALAATCEYIFFADNNYVRCLPSQNPGDHSRFLTKVQFEHPENVLDLYLTSNKQLITRTKSHIFFWDLSRDNYASNPRQDPAPTTGTPIIFDNQIWFVDKSTVAISHDTQHVLASDQKGPIVLYNRTVDDLEEQKSINSLLPLKTITIVAIGKHFGAYGYENGIFIVVNLENPIQDFTVVNTLKKQMTTCKKLQFSRNERFIFGLGSNHKLYIWNREDNCTLVEGDIDCNAFCLTPDESSLIAADPEGSIGIWHHPITKYDNMEALLFDMLFFYYIQNNTHYKKELINLCSSELYNNLSSEQKITIIDLLNIYEETELIAAYLESRSNQSEGKK